ncbi:MAG TPA: cyanophycinase [Clostridiaceae bacterium]
MEEKTKGGLIIIGGAEDKKESKDILKEVASRVVDRNGSLLIATVAALAPEEVGKQYLSIFKEIGIEKLSLLNINCREDARLDKNIDLIKEASLVFFTGGDQLRVTSLLGGTPLYKAIIQSYERDCIYVGTSAGASAMSDIMVVQGPDDEAPRKCTLKLAPGLGLIRGVIIDQHFAQRGRIGRLLTGIAENPEALGIGVDEDTAIIVDKDSNFQVIGSGAVYIIDGSTITQSNVSEQEPEEVLSIFNVKVHVLKKGNRFNIKERIPIIK